MTAGLGITYGKAFENQRCDGNGSQTVDASSAGEYIQIAGPVTLKDIWINSRPNPRCGLTPDQIKSNKVFIVEKDPTTGYSPPLRTASFFCGDNAVGHLKDLDFIAKEELRIYAAVSDDLNPGQTFSGDGATVTFTITAFLLDPLRDGGYEDLIVEVGGTRVGPSLWSISGTDITFASAPGAGTNNISVYRNDGTLAISAAWIDQGQTVTKSG
jgi:hypothetical protein